jgi:hypothetical protein
LNKRGLLVNNRDLCARSLSTRLALKARNGRSLVTAGVEDVVPEGEGGAAVSVGRSLGGGT